MHNGLCNQPGTNRNRAGRGLVVGNGRGCPVDARSLWAAVALVAWVAFVGAAGGARADASVAVGSAGALERVAQMQDDAKNGNAASFGSPVMDDRRLFKLRWRMPWLLAGGSSLGPTPFASGFTPALALGDGLALLAEPTEGGGLSSLIPSAAFGEEHKLAQLQLGALSTSLGHATLVDHYTNSPDGAARSPGVLLEGNLAGLGAQGLLANALDPMSSLSAGRVYGRPLMWFGAPDATFQPNEFDLDPRTELLGVWVIGVSGVVDAAAPTTAGTATTTVWATGIDNEAALLDNQLVKTILFLDVNSLGAGGVVGTGVHPGWNAMLDAMGLRLDGTIETHFGTDGYVPRYFDRLYTLERTAALGADGKPKVDVARPASWGYSTRLSAGYLETLTGFVAASDQFAFDPTRGANAATVTVGASAFLFFVGGAVTASQTGITDYADPHVFGRGFVVTAEGRVCLVMNTIHVVGRWWRAHQPAGDSPEDYVVNEGTTLGVELNFDFL